MKVLTVIATIFLPLTFIAGIYGMNFADGPYNVPELAWRFGYPAVMLGMLAVGLLMLWAFRRRNYL
jgi:magnesium transporter